MITYIKRNWKPLVLAFLFSTIASIVAVRVQFLKGDVLDYALTNNRDNTLKYGLLLGLFIILEIGFYYLYDLSKGRFIVNSIKGVRFDYFTSLLSKAYPEFLKKKHGEYIARFTNQMELIENQYFSIIPLLAEILIKIVTVSIFLFILDFRLAIVTLILLTTPLYIPKLVEKKLERAQEKFVHQFENHINKVSDWLSGFEVIKNFSVEQIIKEKFKASNDLTMEKNLRKKEMGYLTRTISAFLSYFSHFIILVFAAYLVLVGDFTAGNFFVAVGMIDQLSYPIISLSYFIQDLISVRPVNKSILESIHEKPMTQGSIDIDKRDFSDIELDGITFSYGEEEPILNNLNLQFSDNKRYLLKGPSGSGKTTSMNLLLDYFKPDEGSVKINQVNVSEIKNLNELITVMRQDSILFQDTLRHNITMYQDISDERLIATLRDVGLANYGSSEKLNGLVDEKGTNFSGGEKRRITLARSLLRETPVLILDEPLANLDEENAKAIESLILKIKDRTVIIISHQFSQENLGKLDGVVDFS